jgi:hypothetical protein
MAKRHCSVGAEKVVNLLSSHIFFYSFHCRLCSQTYKAENSARVRSDIFSGERVFHANDDAHDYNDYSNDAPAESKNTFWSRPVCVCAEKESAAGAFSVRESLTHKSSRLSQRALTPSAH